MVTVQKEVLEEVKKAHEPSHAGSSSFQSLHCTTHDPTLLLLPYPRFQKKLHRTSEHGQDG